ncbi:MAG: radical SAM protein, partial [Clostridiales bacterium]|nr:radical SAM protein [Clostridiales bacterium]
MIPLSTNLEGLRNDLCDVARLFFGGRPAAAIEHCHEDRGDRWVERYAMGGARFEYQAPAVRGGLAEMRMLKRAAKTGLFLLLRRETGVSPPWGSLTGIRPTRLIYEFLEQGNDLDAAAGAIEDTFFVAREKASLLRDIVEMQRGIRSAPAGQFDLYLGIPFCTTRCSYCSFASGELGDGRLVRPYLDALAREIDGAAQLARENGLAVRAGYVGGGTPTALTADQLGTLLDRAMDRFPGASEWTVEAGRPDTIDRAKLRAMRARGVTRISVNPQTFSDQTLQRIGRAHAAGDAEDAFLLARDEGFDDVNMDLIAALPGEDLADFTHSIERTIALFPESVTVHTLAIKRAS